MNDDTQSDLEKASERPRSPKEFAEDFAVNLNNVYYWMRRYGLGNRPEGKRSWELAPEDQRKLVELRGESRPRPSAPKRTHESQARGPARRVSESVESIRVKLNVDEQTARLIRLLIEPGARETLLELVGTLCEYKKPFAHLFDHDRLLLMAAKLLGYTRIVALAPPDGYPSLKYIDVGDDDTYTLIYRIPNGLFLIQPASSFVSKDMSELRFYDSLDLAD